MSLLSAILGAIAGTTPPPGPTVTNANCYPATGLSSVTVNNTTQLQTQVNSAPAGRHILLAAGTYAGNVSITSSAGTEDDPVVIRPAGAIGSPVVTNGVWTLENNSARVVIMGGDFNGARLVVNGSHNRVDRCVVRNITGTGIRLLTSRDGRVSRCEFHTYVDNGAGKAGVFVEPAGFGNGTNVRNRIDNCHFHDFVTTLAGNGQDMIRTFGIVNNYFLDPDDVDVLTIDRCLFERYNVFGENEAISIKSGGWTVQRCTFNDCAGWLNQRHSMLNRILSCWFEDHTGNNGDGCNLFGDDHLVAGCRFVNSDLRLSTGNITFDDPPATWEDPIRHVARRCQVVDNIFDNSFARIGVQPTAGETLPAEDNNLWNNVRLQGGAAHTLSLETGTTFIDPGLGPFDAAVKLAPADVGLNAEDPYC